MAKTAAFSESTNAARTWGSCHATENHLTLSPRIGQLCTFEELKA